jgi:hypothetical protein
VSAEAELHQVTIGELSSTDGGCADVYVNEDGQNGIYGEGKRVATNFCPSGTGPQTVTFDVPYETVSRSATVEFVTRTGGLVTTPLDETTSSRDGYSNSKDGDAGDALANVTVSTGTPSNVAVRDSWGDTKEFGSIDDGETVTKTLDLRTDDSLLVTFVPNGGWLSGTVRYEETSYPRNPTIRVNGHVTGYTGRLAPGETVSLSTNTSWLRSGTNTVTVEVGTGSPADAPDQAVDLRYRHDLDPTGPPPTENASTPVQNASGPTTGDGPDAPANTTADDAVDSDSSPETTATGTPTPLTDTTVVDVSFEQETIRSSEAAIVVVTVRNPGEAPDSHTVELEMFGQVINSREVSVPADGETTVRFEHNIVAPGTYTARVDGETATIRVLEPDQTPAPSTPGATSTASPGLGPAVALLALLLAALALARRD